MSTRGRAGAIGSVRSGRSEREEEEDPVVEVLLRELARLAVAIARVVLRQHGGEVRGTTAPEAEDSRVGSRNLDGVSRAARLLQFEHDMARLGSRDDRRAATRDIRELHIAGTQFHRLADGNEKA